MNFTFVIMLAAFALGLYLVLEFVAGYRLATGTTWHRAIVAADQSATKLWAKFTMFLGAATALLVNSADYFGDPALGAAIQSALKPTYVALFMVFVAFVTILARNRTK